MVIVINYKYIRSLYKDIIFSEIFNISHIMMEESHVEHESKTLQVALTEGRQMDQGV